VRAGAELEHDRDEAEVLDRTAGGGALLRQLLESRAHEDADPLIGSEDHGGGGVAAG
jgi:hypothetical protein